MTYTAGRPAWVCSRRFCDGSYDPPKPAWDGKPSPPIGKVLADLDDRTVTGRTKSKPALQNLTPGTELGAEIVRKFKP